VNKFFSPSNLPIDQVGIAPHVDLSGVDELAVARLVLADTKVVAPVDPVSATAAEAEQGKKGFLQLNAGPNHFAIAVENLRKPENWALGMKLLDSAYVTTTLNVGGENGWETFPEIYLEDRTKIYYPDYIQAGNLPGISLDKQFTVTFTHGIDPQSVSADSIELINSATGERVKTTFEFQEPMKMKVKPQAKLQADTSYWLVIHPTIKDDLGRNITGGVAVAKTVK
jgi:carboxyl-terminal processing protease